MEDTDMNKQDETNKIMIHNMIEKAIPLELELVWIPRIMEKQTQDEADQETTKYHNDIGLSGMDGKFIGSIWHQIQNKEKLSNKQIAAVKRVLPKYWRQYIGMMKVN